MEFQVPSLDELRNESDVEQKLVIPFFLTPLPYGLGIKSSSIQTKASIRRFEIGKGNEQKLYFPDYLIVVGGYPLVVVEVKSPTANVEEGFREARLYATELNSIYPSGLNPLTLILSTNGSSTLAGKWDQGEPEYKLTLAELNPYSEKVAALQKMFGNDALLDRFRTLAESAKNKKAINFRKPRRLVGGQSRQQEEIGHNTFGATIAADFGRIFNPSSREDRTFIARHGYIPSRRRERYIDPIDRVIRASTPPSETDAIQIDDTGSPSEIIRAFKDTKPLEHQVLLIVGSVGSGKTTFVDYLQDVALPRQVIDRTTWVRLDMNAAPISTSEIYDWLRKEIVTGCKTAYPEIDFDDLDTITSVFSVEVNRFNKGIGRLYAADKTAHSIKLADMLQELNGGGHAKTAAYSRYCSTERGKLLVIVLDNCDKRSRDEQLLMFQAAQWIQKEFRSLVVLPLREETYDNHRDEPPLDTALKDLVFRVEPPLFHHVLVKRVQLALNEIAKSGSKTLRYELPNGFHVEYPAADQAFYLTAILRSIFEHDRYVRRMIVGLAARNMRRALEIFLEFCTSGHIGEDQIFRINQTEGRHFLPLFLVTRVLLRMNRRFYDSDFSYLKNIFAANKEDTSLAFFTRLIILRWLHGRFAVVGPTGLKGYFPVEEIKRAITPYGIEEKVLDREVEYLVAAQCVVVEDLRVSAITDEDLLRLAPAGFVHLEMMGNIDYLAAVAEDTWFSKEEIAQQVAARISQLELHYKEETAAANANDLLAYLQDVRNIEMSGPRTFLENSEYEKLTDLSIAAAVVEINGHAKNESKVTKDEVKKENGQSAAPISGAWINADLRFPKEQQIHGTIVNRKWHGCYVELEPGLVGMIHRTRLPSDFESDDAFLAGENIRARVVRVDLVHRKIDLHYLPSPSDKESVVSSDWVEGVDQMNSGVLS